MGRNGFTLIELISVILILGIVSAGVLGFIGRGAEIYVDTTQRDQLLSDSRFLIERITREVRQALPNSVRQSNIGTAQCLEFVPIKWSSFYLDVPVAPEPASNTIRTIPLGVAASGEYVYESGDSVVVFPKNPAEIYAAPQTNGPGNNFAVGYRTLLSPTMSTASQITSLRLATLPNIPNGLTRFTQDSPASRLYIVGTPVSYCANFNTNEVRRYSGYGFSQIQPTFESGGVLMALSLVNSFPTQTPFRVKESVFSRNAVVHLRFLFEWEEERVEFNYEVHIPNAP